MTSLVNFRDGAPLDADAARAKHTDGKRGFYMATVKSDAEFFAVRRIGGGNVLSIDIDDDVLQELRRLGAEQRAIPGNPPYFIGDEVYVPEALFPMFNARMRDGHIRVSL